MNKVDVYAIGPMSASACAPKELLPIEVEAEVNRQHPTGIESMWEIANGENFATGQSNPCTCGIDLERRHWLLHC